MLTAEFGNWLGFEASEFHLYRVSTGKRIDHVGGLWNPFVAGAPGGFVAAGYYEGVMRVKVE